MIPDSESRLSPSLTRHRPDHNDLSLSPTGNPVTLTLLYLLFTPGATEADPATTLPNIAPTRTKVHTQGAPPLFRAAGSTRSLFTRSLPISHSHKLYHKPVVSVLCSTLLFLLSSALLLPRLRLVLYSSSSTPLDPRSLVPSTAVRPRLLLLPA